MSICIKVWFCRITLKVSSSISNSIKVFWVVLKIKYTNGRIGGRRLLHVEFCERGFLAGNCSSSSLMHLTHFIKAHCTSIGPRCSEITDTEFIAEIACCWNLGLIKSLRRAALYGLQIVFCWLWDCEMSRISGPPVGIRNMKATYQVRMHTLQVSRLLNQSLSYNCPAKHNAICVYF
jgi:hypothetical protein